MNSPAVSLRLYASTILELGDEPFCVDLRKEISEAARTALIQVGLAGKFAVLTAWNPLGSMLPEETNRLRAHHLVQELRNRKVPFVRADGCSPDRLHREEGVAAPLDREDALSLARHFGQNAIFWFDGERFWILCALLPCDPVSLPA